MPFWLRRRGETAERIGAVAEALIIDHGLDAYREARRMEREAKSEVEAKNWDLVALAVARKTGKRVGFDTATRMTIDVAYSTNHQSGGERMGPHPPDLDQLEELKRIIAKR